MVSKRLLRKTRLERDNVQQHLFVSHARCSRFGVRRAQLSRTWPRQLTRQTRAIPQCSPLLMRAAMAQPCRRCNAFRPVHKSAASRTAAHKHRRDALNKASPSAAARASPRHASCLIKRPMPKVVAIVSELSKLTADKLS